MVIATNIITILPTSSVLAFCRSAVCHISNNSRQCVYESFSTSLPTQVFLLNDDFAALLDIYWCHKVKDLWYDLPPTKEKPFVIVRIVFRGGFILTTPELFPLHPIHIYWHINMYVSILKNFKHTYIKFCTMHILTVTYVHTYKNTFFVLRM